MNATIYKGDFKSKTVWENMLDDLGLPSGTDEICVKAISHITKSQREKKNADSSGT